MDLNSDQKESSGFLAIPSPPAFLVERQRQVLAGELLNDPIHHLNLIDSTDVPMTEADLPPQIDVSLYKLALQERKAAEMNYAEIYSKYLEVMTFNEKLLRHLRHQEMYRYRVRQVYDRLKYGDDNVHRIIQELQRELKRQQEEINQWNTENKALKISLGSYEEAFNKVTAELQDTKTQLSSSEKQFQILAEEFTQRGYLLSEAEEKIRDYVSRIERMNQALNDVQGFNQQLRDDNIVFKAKLQEVNTGAPNSELGTLLTNSVHRLQEKLTQIEAQSLAERQQAQDRIRELEDRLLALKNNPPVPTNPGPVASEHLQGLYSRWEKVIGELSTLSQPIRELGPTPAAGPKAELMSESGDLAL